MKFADADMEREFKKVHHNAVQIRILLLCGITIYILYLIQDYFLIPEFFCEFVLIRVCVFLPVGIILFLLTFGKAYTRFSSFFLSLFAFIASAGILAMEYIARDNSYIYLYFFGIAQVMMFFYGTGKIPLISSILVGWTILLAAVLMDIYSFGSDIHMIITRALFLFTMSVIGIIVSLVIQYNARLNFINRITIEKLSITDPLTGLRNRHFFENVMVCELLYFINRSGTKKPIEYERILDPYRLCYGIFLLDIDHFKKVNDLYGHAAGDMVLQEFSRRISNLIRANDVVFRWGGEEFLIIMRNMQIDFLETFSQSIMKVIGGEPYEIGRNEKINITVSGGALSVFPGSEEKLTSTDIILTLVDEALYRSKKDGRNRFTRVSFTGLCNETPRKFESIRAEMER